MARLMIAALAVLCGFASGQGDRGPQSGRISSAPFPGAPPAPRPIIPGSTPDSLPPEFRRVIPPAFGQSLARWRTPLPAEMNHSHTRTQTFAWSSTWTSLSDEESSLIRNVTIRCSCCGCASFQLCTPSNVYTFVHTGSSSSSSFSKALPIYCIFKIWWLTSFSTGARQRSPCARPHEARRRCETASQPASGSRWVHCYIYAMLYTQVCACVHGVPRALSKKR